MTPEGRVKSKVKKAIKRLQTEGHKLYYHMPVQNGMGAPSLDFVGCAYGRFFGIETKAPGQNPTKRQEMTIDEMEAGGGVTFVIRDDDDVEGFTYWVERMRNYYG